MGKTKKKIEKEKTAEVEAHVVSVEVCNGGALPGDWQPSLTSKPLNVNAPSAEAYELGGPQKDRDDVHTLPSREEIQKTATSAQMHPEWSINVDYGYPCCPHVYRAIDKTPAEAAQAFPTPHDQPDKHR